MSIRSDTFGRVTLTGAEADKFKKQVIYGKAKKAAVETSKKGVELSRKFSKNGKLHLKIVMG